MIFGVFVAAVLVFLLIYVIALFVRFLFKTSFQNSLNKNQDQGCVSSEIIEVPKIDPDEQIPQNAFLLFYISIGLCVAIIFIDICIGSFADRNVSRVFSQMIVLILLVPTVLGLVAFGIVFFKGVSNFFQGKSLGLVRKSLLFLLVIVFVGCGACTTVVTLGSF